LSLLLPPNFKCQSEKQDLLSLVDDKLIMQYTNNPLAFKQIDSISIWTDAFINYAKVMIARHPLLAGDLLSYMSIIRGAVVDAPFYRVYQYDHQCQLRIAYNQTRTWSQIDGNVCLQFIAKGALSNQSSTSCRFRVSTQKPCYDFNLKKKMFQNQLCS
jgi:hypothetical protein